jgi:hypothetical protein
MSGVRSNAGLSANRPKVRLRSSWIRSGCVDAESFTRPTRSPDGQITSTYRFPLSSPLCKNISVFPNPKSELYDSPSRLTGGAVRDRHGREAGCGGRGCADNERCLRRTAKTCGPDAPTLASSRWKQFRRRRWQESPVAGESTQ